jgi:glycosyltransferase involved in cell wall biosynthesis
MTRIAIASVSILPGDAVGNDIQHMRRALTGAGHHVELFASRPARTEPCDEDGRTIPSFLGRDRSAVLLYHHAISWPQGFEAALQARCRRVIRYHNVTPAHFYDAISPKYAGYCRDGREQMRRLARTPCDLYLSDSVYNQTELLEAGADANRCRVIPPFHQIDRLRQVQADPEVLRDYGDGATNLLFVGRRVPNKGHRFLIDAFAAYRQHYEPNSRLLLVGKGDPVLGEYATGLREQVKRLGLKGCVMFLDGATDAELKAYYQTSSVFVVASEHEGFCVPVVEAMALGVPVVAYGTTAVPHTLGEAGLVWDEPDPFLLAQSVHTVVRDAALRQRLIQRGFQRYQERFDNQQIQAAFLDAVLPLCAA